MTVRWYYMNPAEEAEEFTDGVREPLLVRSGAEEGSAEICQVVVEDEDSIYDFLAWRRVYALDDEAPADEQVIWMGSISDIWLERMHPFTATSRKWTLSLTDLNYIFVPRIFDEEEFDRPAETDLQRLTALLAYDGLAAYVVTDTDYQATTGGVALDARDFKQQAPYDVLHDMGEASNRNFFAFFNEADSVSP